MKVLLMTKCECTRIIEVEGSTLRYPYFVAIVNNNIIGSYLGPADITPSDTAYSRREFRYEGRFDEGIPVLEEK